MIMYDDDTALLPIRLDWRALCVHAGVDERELRAACRRRRYARGETIFHEGDPAGALHLLDAGHVAVKLTTPLGDVAIIDVLHPGDAFGEQALVDETDERSATVTAIEKTETLALDRASFAAMRVEHPGVDRFLLVVVSTRLRATSHQLLEARFLPGEQRMYRCVARLAESFAETNNGAIPLTQADIASIAGVTRSTANRLLGEAQRDGVLHIGRSRIEVLDLQLLHRRAGLR
jgi:CRP-like cAMP-binding protein